MSRRAKVAADGPEGYRTEDPEETLSRIEPLIKKAGISRVADITGLDRIGIPVFSTIRPSAETGAISIYNGKGLTPTQARISAIMEGIERYSAEMHGDVLVRELMDDMLAKGNALDPRELILPIYTKMRLKDMPIAWSKGTDIGDDREILVPASAVFHPYSSSADLTLFRSNTNGLASGNTLPEATLHGLCEVVERDAWSLSEVKRKVVSDITIGEEKGLLKDTLERFTSKGVEVHLKNLTSDIGMPVIAAAADDVQLQDAGLLTLGIGAHPSPRVAALKALTEVAQSRLTQIHGAREDTVMAEGNRKLGYDRVKRMNQLWFGKAPSSMGIDELENIDQGSIEANITGIVNRIHVVGLRSVITVDLTRKEIGVPVVRVVVPGLEVFSIDSDRVGRRLMEAERSARG
ncbi:MAG TPA: YcaO-related McrA-glycine thioamidation protein [Methanomassiliicoccales archaeon]|jgi:ribosomal protein S12 methylthiotransferase accessory factor